MNQEAQANQKMQFMPVYEGIPSMMISMLEYTPDSFVASIREFCYYPVADYTWREQYEMYQSSCCDLNYPDWIRQQGKIARLTPEEKKNIASLKNPFASPAKQPAVQTQPELPQDVSIDDFLSDSTSYAYSQYVSNSASVLKPEGTWKIPEKRSKFDEWGYDRKKRREELIVQLPFSDENARLLKIRNAKLEMRQRPDDQKIYFNKNEQDLYELLAYEWSGPRFQTTTIKNTESRNSSSSRRTGRAAGALAGTLILPGAGTVLGAMMGTGNKKNEGFQNVRETMETRQTEIPSPALIRLRHLSSNKIIELRCNIMQEQDTLLCNFQKAEAPKQESAKSQSSSPTLIEQLVELTRLKDAGAISEEEFLQAKKVLLGL